MLSTLRTHPGPRLNLLALWLLASVLPALTFSTCTAQPLPLRAASSNAQPAPCSAMVGHERPSAVHGGAPAKECTFKPCCASQPAPAFTWRLDKPLIPALLMYLAWLSAGPPHNHLPRSFRMGSPPPGRRIALILRFCTLLN